MQTAEMPGFYQQGEYDVAGFAVGSVKKDQVIDGKQIEEGDVLLGLPSSGVHSNGFSLARRVLEVNLCRESYSREVQHMSLPGKLSQLAEFFIAAYLPTIVSLANAMMVCE